LPAHALSHAEKNQVAIYRDGRRIAVVIPSALFDLYKLYEQEHRERSDEDPQDRIRSN